MNATIVNKKLLFVIGDLADMSSGPYLSLRETISHLKDTKIITIGSGLNFGSIDLGWSSKVISLKRIGPISFHFTPQISKLLNENKFSKIDLVSMQLVWSFMNYSVSKWCISNDIPYMISGHGNFNPVALKISRKKKLIAKYLILNSVLLNAKCFQALTKSEYANMRNAGIKNPICIIPNGISIPKIDLISQFKQNKYSALRTCLYIGRLHKIKGIERLLRAWSKCNFEGKWRLLIVGGGDKKYELELRNLSNNLKCKNVEFIGPTYGIDKNKLIINSEFLILTSFSEGLPMSILEGFSYSKTALVTADCGFNEAADIGACYEVKGDQDEINYGLNQMLNSSPDKLIQMGQYALEYVKNNHSWEKIANDLNDVYNWMLGGVPPKCLYFN